MRELNDAKMLEHYLAKYQIRSLFDTPDLPFRLWEYEVGEMMNLRRTTNQYLKFVVAGSFDLYTVRPDGTLHLIRHCDQFGFLGDLEFCGKSVPGRYQEVTETVHTVELPLGPMLETLRRDNRFLLYLLDSMSDKLSGSVTMKMEFSTLEDALLYHLRYECPDHAITKIEETAYRLNYSRRQLQRVLRDLTNRGIIRHTRKGFYQLMETD